MFVANDWHSGLVPVLLKNKYQPNGEFAKAKCAFVVHNIAFQGRFWAKETSLEELGVPAQAHGAFAFEDGYPTVYSEKTPADEDEPQAKLGTTYEKYNWMQVCYYPVNPCG